MSIPSPVRTPSLGSFFRAGPPPLLRQGAGVNLLILVVDDEPDVEMLFRAHFRRDLREGRFTMEFAQSGETALQRRAAVYRLEGLPGSVRPPFSYSIFTIEPGTINASSRVGPCFTMSASLTECSGLRVTATLVAPNFWKSL